MKSRFRIYTLGTNCIVDVNYRYVEYPYLLYAYENSPETLNPFEEINQRDDYSSGLFPLDYWPKEEVVASLLKLNLFLSENSEVLKNNPNWKLNSIASPQETLQKLNEVIETISKEKSLKMATLVVYNY